ncbi:unnamed protein product [Paramecium pentaurelia]|uniref:Carboxypeptidase n=2 Tax=Paramecium pentaurelia TaxID=43138 RepID=A0A8S1XIP1_9CILI|nr:unnamed protein product [Paramecium pentaurelia]
MLLILIFGAFIDASKGLIYSKDQTNFFKNLLPSVNYYIETGYVSVGDLTISDNRLFYSLYLKENILKKTDIKADDEFILWIYGGPGCSSQDSNYNENGPIRVDDDQKLHARETSWNKQAHLMYIDQPFYTGMSYSTKEGLIDNSWDAADYVIELLTQYFEQNKELAKARLHIWGESYGGHYIPVLAEKIKKQTNFNLIGIGIGGAWSHPRVQVIPTVRQLINYGVIDQYRYDLMMKSGIESLDDIDNQEYEKFLTVSDEEIFFNDAVGPNFRYNIQIYNYDDGDQYEEFINDHKLQFDLPLSITFYGCNQDIYYAFAEDQTVSVLPSIDYLLSQEIKVFVYNGQLDTVVSHTGVEYWVNLLKWQDLPIWKKQKKSIWKFINPKTNREETAGTIKSYKQLHFCMVYNAGHQTPTDQPEACFQMLKNYFDI